MNELQIAWIALIVLLIADVVSTHALLKAGGRELNPLLRTAMEQVGTIEALIGSKVLVAAGVYFLAATELWVIIAVGLIYAALLANNIIVIRRLKT